MKLWIVLVCTMVAVSLALWGCTALMNAPAPKQVSVEVSCDDFMKEEHISKEAGVAVDGTLTVTLCSNPTTGFRWELTGMTAELILDQIDQKYEAPTAGAPVGAGGQEVWTFKALKGGETTLTMEYRRPWETETEPAKTFTLTVLVK